MSARLEKLKSRLAAGEMLLCDGAWGTQMQRMGLAVGDCPEEWNVTQPEKVKQLAREYYAAGADLGLTNTFGGNRYRLERYGFTDKVREFNTAGAALSRQVADEFDRTVAASVGPTGEYVEPEGLLKEREMYDAFHEQIAALKEGGADAICVETMYALDEALLAVKAARDLGMFCVASMTFDSTPDGVKTVLGVSVAEAVKALDAGGADVVGTNCGNGMAQMVELARLMRPVTRKPLLVRPNTSLPETVDGKTVQHETPEGMAASIRMLRDAGVAVVGGCCGTTPEHVRAFRAAIDKLR
ncbi:MAG: homocysteine S-methyltransferase family protein [Planctomycetota bacterium]|nr:homocysteine S-methyltransferase family protein [Planctomycetota bacterium]